MHTKTGWKKRIVACGLFSAFSFSISHAATAPYLQIGDGRLAYVYRWLLPDGTVLKQGMTTNHGRASLLHRPGTTDYVLETQWGAYRVTAPDHCWKLKPDGFSACVKVSDREDTEVQKQAAAERIRQEQVERQLRELRVTWMEKDIPADQQRELILDTLTAHQAWMKTSAAEFGEDSFACRFLDLPAPSVEAAEWFEQGSSLPKEEEQELAYIEAARRGHWRAAARLVSLALENEDWESAQPTIAWLLKNNVPSGYTKLAELIRSTSGYDGANASTATKQLVTSLRWRAAQQGDPVAQSQMSRYFEQNGQPQLAQDLLACAQRQNPEIS